MDSQDLQVLAALRRWSAGGHRAALVTVARTWGSATRPAGAWMALRDDGRVQNLNLLGKREPETYGKQSFEEYFSQLKARFPDIELHYYQSNVEGELINKPSMRWVFLLMGSF